MVSTRAEVITRRTYNRPLDNNNNFEFKEIDKESEILSLDQIKSKIKY